MACVDFNDARAFCKKINDREASAGRLPEGYEYRLPLRVGLVGAYRVRHVLDEVAYRKCVTASSRSQTRS